MTTTSQASIASITPGAGAGIAVEADARTGGSARRRTNQSWNGSVPSPTVSIIVRQGPSAIGRTRVRMPSAAQRRAVTALSDSPARERLGAEQVRREIAIAEREPGRPAVAAHHRRARRTSRPRAPSRAPRRPRPASVYMTVSRSGEMWRPQWTKSSPVLTMAVSVARRGARARGRRASARRRRRRRAPRPHAPRMRRPPSCVEVLARRAEERGGAGVAGGGNAARARAPRRAARRPGRRRGRRRRPPDRRAR